jgi:ribosome-binding protein aMBF1 (putative translation factor)
MWIDLKKVNRNREISGMKRETLAKKIFSNR